MKDNRYDLYKNDDYDDDNIPEIDLPQTVKSVDIIIDESPNNNELE